MEITYETDTPHGIKLASFGTYGEAQKLVDQLSDADFPVERTQIVGRGLQFVEQVTGRLTWPLVLARGALNGLLLGLLVGLMFSVFIVPWQSVATVLGYGALYGSLIGAGLGALMYALSGGRRDFTSVGAVKAEKYEVWCDAEFVDQARRTLGIQAIERDTLRDLPEAA